MQINIDPNAGFCFGVDYAIDKAVDFIDKNSKIYCLGQIVHNQQEIKRLENLGLITIDFEKFKTLKNVTVLLRAHGEPPQTYQIAKQNNINLVDATCPIVLRLQLKVRQKYLEIKPKNGTIVIFGKHNHPEVIGLLGQTDNQAIVVQTIQDLKNIDFTKPIALFSQTTMSADDYAQIIDYVKNNAKAPYIEQSMCKQVANRSKNFDEFCSNNQVIVFVSGTNSSNGKYLFNKCKQKNPNTYFVSDTNQIEKKWFENAHSVGITGATSTPKWQLEQAKAKIQSFFDIVD